MKKIFLAITLLLATVSASARTLIVYYSYTNNVERIVNELRRQIDADVIEIQPAQKGLDYAANNYAIGSAQISAIRNNPDNPASYPDIDPIDTDLSRYDCIIIGAPLWWSNMAAPLQTYLFNHGKEMAGKHIGLIVSSASSGISGVEADARRLIPHGDFMSPSLWIRSAQTSNAQSMLENWLLQIDYKTIAAGADLIPNDRDDSYTVYSLAGMQLLVDAKSTDTLPCGIYIVNGKKRIIAH